MLLSICLAIYKRVLPFRYTFEPLLKQIEDVNDIEIIVSINPSEDGNHDLIDYVQSMKIMHSFRLFINNNNIGGEANIINAVSHAQGKFVWIIGDDDLVLPNCVSHVLGILKEHQKVTWLFMNTARVYGNIEENNKDLITPRIAELKEGYYENGVECIIETHKQIDAALLFSSSNIYLRDAMLEIYELQNDTSDCNQLASAFLSASQGAAYIINTPCILAGGTRTWVDRENYILGLHYNRDILYAVNHGISKKQAKNLISYRMRHDAMKSWFIIFKMILYKDPLGIVAYKELLSLIPLETVLCTVFSPFLAIYLFIRHKVRNVKRRRLCHLYLQNPDGILEIKERIPDNL